MPRVNRTDRAHIVVALAAALVACGDRVDESPRETPPADAPSEAAAEAPVAQGPQVIAHTSGAISRAAAIHVEFDEPSVSKSVDDPSDLLRFEPPLEGDAEWISATRLAFQPSAPLARGTRYQATVEVPGGAPAKFEFSAVPQSFEVTWSGLEAESDGQRTFRGEISTRDRADPARVEEMLSFSLEGQTLEARWAHSDDGRRHGFEIAGIERLEQAQTLKFEVDGAPIDVADEATHEATVPGLGTFSVLSARSRGRTGPIEVRFSDPIARNQNPAGLFDTESDRSLRIEVRGSVVRLYSPRAWEDVEIVTVSKSVRNRDGRRLKRGRRLRVEQAARKPSVKFLGKGVILPLKSGVAVPIETASLRAVRVKAIRVPPSNLGQFFQVNALDGTTEMIRVGKVVWRQRVELGDDLGGGAVRHGLDLSKLVERQGEGLYNLELDFRPEDTNYDCPAGSFDGVPPDAFSASDESPTDYSPDESSNWDFAWGAWISGLEPGEQYRQRNNPCHIAYYVPQRAHDIRASRNVLLTNVAVVAKRDPSHRLSVYATDLLTTEPLANAAVEAYDFSQHLLSSGKTGADGRVRLDAKDRAYTVMVRHGGQLGAIRLHDAESLAVSHFDVGGAEVEKGLKGYLYGERGVWRPGDDIFLHFILKDDDGRIPEDHPVTFTLKGPRGAVVDSQRITESVGRFYAIKTRTGREAPTGNYRAEVLVGGAKFARTLSVEAVVPNRLKIDFDFGTDLLEGPKAKLDSTLRVRWLHGAVARSLKTEIDVAFGPTKTRFSKYGDYTFDDPTRRLSTSPQRIFQGKLDKKGEVEVDSVVAVDGSAPGMLRATFTTRVFEESGQSSVDRHTLRFAPYERFIGVKIPKGDKARGMLLTDVDHPVDIVAVDAQGEPVDTTVTVRVQKISWRWWWEKGAEDLSQYAGQSSHTTIAEDEVQVSKGRGQWKFQIKYPSWGRYLITVSDDRGGHRTGQVFYADWPGWAGRGQKDNPGGPAVLTVVADQPRVEVGEKIAVTFPTPAKGRALVTLESGQRVVSSEWVDVQGKTTRHEVVATSAMTPNVYVHVMLLQPYDNQGNDHPMRLYGLTPVAVKNPKTILEPVIDAPTEMRPATKQTIRVREAEGRAMTYTLAVVDEGLLGLTRFQTPDPWAHFHRREGLGVKTWDNFNHVAGGFAGALETLLAIGGGDGAEDDDGTKARRFPPVVIVEGPFALKAGETKEHELDIPTYLGEVRVMVVAGTESAYGAADRSVFVRKPLMAYATVPRVLSPRDVLEVPVTVFSTMEDAHEVNVELAVTGDAKSPGKPETLAFDGGGEEAVSFPLEIGTTPGQLELRFTARSKNAQHTETLTVDVRYPNPPEVTVATRTLEPGGVWSPKLVREGLRAVSAEVAVYRGRAIGLGQRLARLIEYPHGCLEQTVSRAFPQVFITDLQEITPEDGQRIQGHVSAALEKLRLYQAPSGGFGVWPNDRSHDWTTTWVGHFLLEARRAGFVVPEGMIERWRSFQERKARRWSELGGERAHLAQAYRLYTLALDGNPDLSSMNRLRELEGLDPQASLRLGVAYALAGAPEVAGALVPENITYTDVEGPDPSFGSALRDRAMAIEALILLGREDEAKALADPVAEALDSDRSLSTQETAYALIAMSKYVTSTSRGPAPTVKITSGGDEMTVELEKSVFRRTVKVPDLDGADAAKHRFSVENTGGDPVEVRLVRQGQPDIGESEASSRGLAVGVDYDIPKDGFVQGEDITAEVTVKNETGRRIEDLALTQIVPSGWEIRNDRFEGRRDPGGLFDYRDVRDDRVHTYFGLDTKASKTFEVRLHAAFVGRFYLPPVRVESMYDAGIQAQTSGRWIEVVPPGAVD